MRTPKHHASRRARSAGETRNYRTGDGNSTKRAGASKLKGRSRGGSSISASTLFGFDQTYLAA
jgi:hypothetical protein